LKGQHQFILHHPVMQQQTDDQVIAEDGGPSQKALPTAQCLQL
jgi:hypothetical protein